MLQFAKIDFTTSAGGAATVTFSLPDGPFFLYRVSWVVGTCDAGVDVVLTAINTASGVNQTLLNLTDANSNAVYYPRVAEHNTTGVAGSGTAIPLFTGDLQLAVTSGGNVKTGSCLVYYGE